MKVYMCKVYDGSEKKWTDIGVFSTLAKAMEAGSHYILNVNENISLIDWDHSYNTCIDWYTHYFTRVVMKVELDLPLT